MSILVDLVKEDYGLSGAGRWFRSDVHSSLVVDAEKDIFFFNSREISGNAVDYLVKIRGFPRKSAEGFVKHYGSSLSGLSKETGLQVRFEKLVDLFYKSGKENRTYWKNRGLTDSTIDRYRLGFFDDWYLIPIYDGGRFINFQCRREEPEKRIKFWYKDSDFKPVLYNNEILKFVESCYITEGMVDCILLNQLGFPTVCSTNGAMSWNPGWIRYFTRIKDIVYIADNDEGGISGARMASNYLGSSRVKVLRFKDKAQKYGALNYFKESGTIEGFKSLLESNSVFSFEKGLI